MRRPHEHLGKPPQLRVHLDRPVETGIKKQNVHRRLPTHPRKRRLQSRPRLPICQPVPRRLVRQHRLPEPRSPVRPRLERPVPQNLVLVVVQKNTVPVPPKPDGKPSLRRKANQPASQKIRYRPRVPRADGRHPTNRIHHLRQRLHHARTLALRIVRQGQHRHVLRHPLRHLVEIRMNLAHHIAVGPHHQQNRVTSVLKPHLVRLRRNPRMPLFHPGRLLFARRRRFPLRLIQARHIKLHGPA